jgi:Domain of unknown function (DUF4351)
LMQTSPERRVELYAESLKRIALSSENDFRRYILTECLEAYVKLDEAQQQKFEDLWNSEQYREVKPIMINTIERAKAEGKAEGQREMTLFLLNERFGPLKSEIQQRIALLNFEQLQQLGSKLLKASSLKELNLEE